MCPSLCVCVPECVSCLCVPVYICSPDFVYFRFVCVCARTCACVGVVAEAEMCSSRHEIPPLSKRGWVHLQLVFLNTSIVLEKPQNSKQNRNYVSGGCALRGLGGCGGLQPYHPREGFSHRSTVLSLSAGGSSLSLGKWRLGRNRPQGTMVAVKAKHQPETAPFGVTSDGWPSVSWCQKAHGGD